MQSPPGVLVKCFDGPGPVVLLTAWTVGVTVSGALRPYSGKHSEASAISGLVG